MKTIALTLAFGALAMSSHAVVLIDDFMDMQGPLTVNVDNPAAVDYKAFVPGAIGGSRGLGLTLVGSDYKQDSTVRVGNGAFGNNEFGNASRAYLAYFATGTSGLGWTYSVETNYDMSDATEFRFDVLGMDGDIGVYVDLIDYDEMNDVLERRIYNTTFLAGGPREEVIGMDKIIIETANFDASTVDFLWIYFDAPTNSDFGIGKIDAVPEPGTLAGVALGLAALARRRRR